MLEPQHIRAVSDSSVTLVHAKPVEFKLDYRVLKELEKQSIVTQVLQVGI